MRARMAPATWLVIAGLVTPITARAQSPSMAGSYRLVPERSDRVEAAVEEATDGAGFFVRTVGRRMLAGKLKPAERLQITVTDTLIIIEAAEGPERAIVVGGRPLDRWERQGGDGDAAAVVAWWEGTVLRVRFAEGEGTREYRYSLDPDGRTLRVGVRVNGDKLPRPVELSLTYERQLETLLDGPGRGT